MKNHKIAICDPEVDFTFGLMNYINGQPDNPCMALAFTSEDNLNQYLKENKVELLIVDDHTTMQLPDWLPVLWLSDGEDMLHKECLLKYQSVDQIIPKILNSISQHTQLNKIRDPSACTIYGIYSPVGRCGKTNLAKAICMEMEEPSLYIGMEEYSSFSNVKSDSAELLYYIKQKDDKILSRILSFVIEEGKCNMIPSPESYLDIRELDYEDMRWFLQILKESGVYYRIVFDLGTGSLMDYQIFNLFDKIYVPILDDSIAQIKKEHFLSFLEKSNLNQFTDKMKLVQPPMEPYNSNNMMQYIKQLMGGEVFG